MEPPLLHINAQITVSTIIVALAERHEWRGGGASITNRETVSALIDPGRD